MSKLREARDAIDEMREDDEAEDNRQEVDMHIADRLNKGWSDKSIGAKTIIFLNSYSH